MIEDQFFEPCLKQSCCWSVRAIWWSRRSRTAHTPELEELVERADKQCMIRKIYKDLGGQDTHDQEEYVASDGL